MKYAIVIGVFAWLLSVIYLLATGDAGFIFWGGLIAGLLIVVGGAFAAIQSGRREKRMWAE